MSKRAGEFVTLREVVEEVGADAIRFMMLYRKNDAPLDFDFAKVTEQSKDNPVFYVQYAHARICSVFRNAEVELGELISERFSRFGGPVAAVRGAGAGSYPQVVRISTRPRAGGRRSRASQGGFLPL